MTMTSATSISLVSATPEQFGAFVRREFEKWRTVVRESGAVVD